MAQMHQSLAVVQNFLKYHIWWACKERWWGEYWIESIKSFIITCYSHLSSCFGTVQVCSHGKAYGLTLPPDLDEPDEVESLTNKGDKRK
jgi:hypothetical protein